MSNVHALPVPKTPHAEVVEKLRDVLELIEKGELHATRTVIAVQGRNDEGAIQFFVTCAGDFTCTADEVGLIETAKYARLEGQLG